MWTLYFLEAQVYKIKDNVLYQDNKSSILLETNERGSSGKRTRHIAVRYFFIADRVKSKEIRIEYSPTGIMVADYFRKQLQGLIFRQLREMIMDNMDIALPSDEISTTLDRTSGIPAVSTQQESRSVLEIDSLPRYLILVAPMDGAVPVHAPSVTEVKTSNKVLTSQSQFWKLRKLRKQYSKGDPESAPFPIASVTANKKILSWSDIVTGKETKI